MPIEEPPDKARRLRTMTTPLTPEEAAWLAEYDKTIAATEQKDAADFRRGIRNLSPDWIDSAAPTLLKLYKDTIRLEEAYKYFIENYVKNEYKTRIQNATKNTIDHGGLISDVSAAEAALGEVQINAAGAHMAGTNWLNVKTKWRQFGLITGYNMQFQQPSVLDIAAEEEEQGAFWAKFFEFGEQERTLQLVSAKSPRYRTLVGGSSEPGLSATSTSYEDAGTAHSSLGTSNWFYRNADTLNAAPPDSAGTLDPGNLMRRQYEPDDPEWSALVAGTARNDDRRHALDPLFYGTTIQIDNYFSKESTAQDTPYGHFLSPEIMDLITLVGVGRKTIDRQSFLAARGDLLAAGTTILNGVNPLISPGGYYQWIKADAAPALGAMGKAWSNAVNQYGVGAYASYNGGQYGVSSQKSVSTRAIFTNSNNHIFPDRLAIRGTLPLEGIPFIDQDAQYSWDVTSTFPGATVDIPGRGIYRHASAAIRPYEDYIVETVPVAVKGQWSTLYSGFENGTNALAALDTAIREHIGTDIHELFGYSDLPLDKKPSLHDEVERILDFFGAGAKKKETGAQQREDGITGGSGAAPNLAEITDEAKDVVGNYRALKPFDLQCYLMENIDAVTEIHKRKVQQDPYRNLIPLVSGEGGPGATISQLNHVGDEEAKAILNLPTAVYGALTPYIKIYRVDYDPETGMIPIGQQELPIPNYTSPDDIKKITGGARLKGWGLQSFTWKLDGVQPAEVDNNISANLSFYFQTINDLFEGSARSAGGNQAGLKKATPLDLLISAATIKSSLPEKDPEQDEDPNDKPKTCKAVQNAALAASTKYEGAQYRIKVVAGWSTPPRHMLRDLWPTTPGIQDNKREKKLDALIKALNATRISLYLQQVRHNINFNENGSVKLSIDYQAALTGILTGNKMDILGPTDKKTVAEIQSLETKVKKTKKKINDIEQSVVIVTGKAEVQRAELKTKTKPHREEMKKLLERKKELLNEDRLRKYRRFLSELYGRPPAGVFQPLDPTRAGETKIYSMVVPAVNLLETPLGQMKDPEERAARARERMRTGEKGLEIIDTLGANPFNTNLIDAITDEDTARKAGTVGTDNKNTVSHNISNQWNRRVGSNRQNIDVINIPYFYLGDLIDMIIENNDVLGANGEPAKALKANFLMFLSDMYVTNPLLLYQFQNSDEIACADNIDDNEVLEQLRAKGLLFYSGVKKHINIGDIPISLDQFNVWFKNHVVKNQRNSYYLLHFLKDICATLIGDALKKGCFEENVVDDIRFDTSIAHFNNVDKDTGLPRIAPVKARKDGEVAMNLVSTETLATLVRQSTPENDIPPLSLAEHYRGAAASGDSERTAGAEKFFNKFNITSGLILYSTDASPRSRLADVDEDRRVGIYHNYIGSPVGLVKKVSFQRQEQPYLREAKIQKFGNLGAQQLRELYSANLDLVGNTLFKNGQYTFIRPTMAGTDPKLVRMLGLEGYFLITGVSHTISPAGYNVSVTALQEGVNFEDGQLAVEGVALPVDPDLERRPGTAVDRAQQHADEETAANAKLDEEDIESMEAFDRLLDESDN